MNLAPFLDDKQADVVTDLIKRLMDSQGELSPMDVIMVLATVSAAMITAAKKDGIDLKEVIDNYAAQILVIATDLEDADRPWEGVLDD